MAANQQVQMVSARRSQRGAEPVAPPKISPVWREVCKALGKSSVTVLGTLFDMARFPIVTLGMTTLLEAPEVGAEMALVQGIGFVPSVFALYALSNILSTYRGEGSSPADLAAVRRAGDIFSVKLAVLSSLALLAYGYLPLSRNAHQESLIRKFLFTYFPGTLPALWVIVRQEVLTVHGQLWSLAGINLASLCLMGGLSYGLTRAIGGWSLGASFSISSAISLLLFEWFLAKNEQHGNGFTAKIDFSNSSLVESSLKMLSSKGRHSALIFTGGYLAILSTILVQFFQNPNAHNIANGLLNQILYLVLAPGGAIAQTLVSFSIGNVFGELSKLASYERLQGVVFKLDDAKRTLRQNLVINTLVSLVWPALLSASVPFFKGPVLKLLTGGSSSVALLPVATESFDHALPLVLLSGTANTAQSMLLAAKRTIHRESASDSYLQCLAGGLTLGVVAGIIFGKRPDDLMTIWLPIFFISYLMPLLVALVTTIRAFNSLSDDDFRIKQNATTRRVSELQVGLELAHMAELGAGVGDDALQQQTGVGSLSPEQSPTSPALIRFEEGDGFSFPAAGVNSQEGGGAAGVVGIPPTHPTVSVISDGFSSSALTQMPPASPSLRRQQEVHHGIQLPPRSSSAFALVSSGGGAGRPFPPESTGAGGVSSVIQYSATD
jgi:hypothetical protein